MVNQLTPKLFTMPPLFMGIIIAVYVIVVVITAGVGFGLSGSLADISQTSLWQCNDSNATVFDSNSCKGVDIAKYHTVASVSSPNVSKLHKTLLINLVFQHVGNWTNVLSTNVTMDVVIKGRSGNETGELVADERNYTVHVYCENASKWCRPVTLNHINALMSENYDINFSIVKTGKTEPNETRVPWMGDVIVHMQCAHPSFTYVSMIMGPAISVFMIVVMVLFALTCVRVHGFTLHFRWVMLLLGTSVLFNRPLEVLSVYAPGWFFEVFEQLGISIFVVFLCGFWLTLFRTANTQVRKERFFEAATVREKIVIVIMYVLPILFATAITTWQRVHDRDQYDLLNFFSYEALSALLIVMIAFYTGISLYAVFRADAEFDPELMTESNHRRQMIFFILSYVVLGITMLDYVITTLVPSFLDHLGRDAFLSVLLNGYLIVLILFSLPTPKRVKYKVSTKNNVIVITETTDDGSGNERQSIDLSGAPHSSFSMDFHFSNADGNPTISPSSSFVQDTLPVPKGPSPHSSATNTETISSETESDEDDEESVDPLDAGDSI